MEHIRLFDLNNKRKIAVENVDIFAGDGLLHELFEDEFGKQSIRYRKRIYTPEKTLAMFVDQKLRENQSCQRAVQRSVIVPAARKSNLQNYSLDTGAYCKARKRLPEQLMKSFVKRIGSHIEAKCTDGKWKSFNLKLVDGTTLSMPDTIQNQQEYPQHKSQKAGLGFPILRLEAVISFSSGAIIDYEIARYAGKGNGETSLFHKMISGLTNSDLIIADRLYSNYFVAARLLQNNANFIMRSHIGRRVDFNSGRMLGEKDRIATWIKPQRPTWMCKAMYEALPNEILVRELSEGGRLICSSLLDNKKYPRKEIANLYNFRWQIEIDLKNLKQIMQMDVLRCKSPEMIRKEISAHLIAYNILCFHMVNCAKQNKIHRRNISFKNALNAINLYDDYIGFKNSIMGEESMYKMVLEFITYNQVGHRPGRREPRAVKRRPKPYPLLIKPRHIMKEDLYA